MSIAKKKTQPKPLESNSGSSLASTSLTNTSSISGNSLPNVYNESNYKWKKQSDEINPLLVKSSSNKLFDDPFFSIEDPKNNLIDDKSLTNSKIEWLRPKDLSKNPILGLNSTNYSDVLQGSLDDCGLISACCSIVKYSYLIKQVFPSEINLSDKSYKGVVKVNLYLNNEWITIYIDDRLPTINRKLCYSKCKNENNFWLPLIEKAFAKVKGTYSDLKSIDSASCLVSLTGGFVLRLNPTDMNESETIMNYLSECKENNLIVGIVGCELNKNVENEQVSLNKPKMEENSSKLRVGHAFSIVDIVYLSKQNRAFLKMFNCQSTMKLNRKYNETDKKILETHLKTLITDDSQVTYFTYDEFFDYFEIFNLLVIPRDKLPDGQDLNFFGKWDEKSNLIVSRESSLIEKYLNSPHFIFEIKNNDVNSTEQIVLIMNLLVENFSRKDFIGYFVMPICNRPGLDGPGTNFYFVNYTVQNQALSNMDPVCKEIKLLPGRYLFGLIIQNKSQGFQSKNFNLRIATSLNTTINQENFKQINENDTNYLVIERTKEKIKLVLAKCSVCEFILDASYISSGAKTFCLKCYNATFKCEKCGKEVGKDYYTVEQRIYCENCIES